MSYCGESERTCSGLGRVDSVCKLWVWDKTAFEFICFSFDGPVAPSRWQQFKQVMSQVREVFENVDGSAEARRAVKVLKGGKWAAANFLSSGNDSLEHSPVR